jgi:aspartyl/asparaginyl beta-hydroxylase (cupin superfamily)
MRPILKRIHVNQHIIRSNKKHNLKTGHFYYTDVSKPHAVRNNSNTDRIHLVVDCHGNSVIRSVIA